MDREIRLGLDIEAKRVSGENDGYSEMLIAACKARIREACDELPDLMMLDALEKNCSNKEFFTAITNRVKERVAWVQKHLTISSNNQKKLINERLDSLHVLPCTEQNTSEKNALENKLAKILNSEMRNLIQDKRYLECVNFEKASQNFINIVKNCKASDDIHKIKDNNGNNFKNESDLKTHITNFYKNLYRKDELPSDTSIESFLGDDITNNPLVLNSKLTQVEKDNLDRPPNYYRNR